MLRAPHLTLSSSWHTILCDLPVVTFFRGAARFETYEDLMRLEPSDLEDTVPLLAHRKRILAEVQRLRASPWRASHLASLAAQAAMGLCGAAIRGLEAVVSLVGAALWWLFLAGAVLGALVLIQPDLRGRALESLAVVGVMGWYQMRLQGIKATPTSNLKPEP